MGMPCVYPEAVANRRRHAMDTTILAVDLGKFNSVLCLEFTQCP
jgi:hypothetical protein